MSTVVKVKNTNAPDKPVVVRVISQKIIDDGRELVPNGIDEIPAGEEIDFIVHAGQSIRVVEEPAVAMSEDAVTLTAADVGDAAEVTA